MDERYVDGDEEKGGAADAYGEERRAARAGDRAPDAPATEVSWRELRCADEAFRCILSCGTDRASLRCTNCGLGEDPGAAHSFHVDWEPARGIPHCHRSAQRLR